MTNSGVIVYNRIRKIGIGREVPVFYDFVTYRRGLEPIKKRGVITNDSYKIGDFGKRYKLY